MNRTKILDRLLDPIGSYLTPEVAERLVKFRADANAASPRRTRREIPRGVLGRSRTRRVRHTYISAIDFITVLQTKARSVLKRSAKR